MVVAGSGYSSRLGVPSFNLRPARWPANPNPMASKTPLPPYRAKLAVTLMPAPRSSRDLVRLLKFAAAIGLADAETVGHLAEMEALFPGELMGAFQAYRERQVRDN